jgi:cell division protein FtsL
MHQVLRLFVTAFAVVALAYIGGIVSAEAPVKQIKLSEKQVESFIAAHKDMVEAFDKIAGEQSEAAAQAQLDSIAKKYGFKNQNEYDEVVTNIHMVMFGIDPKTKEFTDPPTLAKRDLDDAMTDKTLSEKDKKELMEQLTEQLKTVQPIMYPSNVELVKKYYDKLEPLVQ